MRVCPENPTIIDCGLSAVEYLANGYSIIIEPSDRQEPVTIAMNARSVLEVLDKPEARREELLDIAAFTCLACTRVVEVVDDAGTGRMHARLAEQLR